MDIDGNDFLVHVPWYYIYTNFSIFYFDMSCLHENWNIHYAIVIFDTADADTKRSNTL